MKDVAQILNFLWFKFKRRIFSNSEDELEYDMRKYVHALEKSRPGKKRHLYKLLRAHEVYKEALKRDLLSQSEREWCERIIFGEDFSDDKDAESEIKRSEEDIDGVIKERRSVRSFTDEPLKEEDFEELIDTAKWAPSACNRQSWRFILTRNEEKIRRLGEVRGKWIKDAPSCIIVSIDMNAYRETENDYTSYLDAGAVIQTLLLKVESMEYGACWVNFGDAEVSSEARDEIDDMFSLPESHRIVSIVPIGGFKSKPKPPGRKDSSSLTDLEEYEK